MLFIAERKVELSADEARLTDVSFAAIGVRIRGPVFWTLMAPGTRGERL